jgi:hypothetical protein
MARAREEKQATGDSSSRTEAAMAWKLEGTYFETCSCEVVAA